MNNATDFAKYMVGAALKLKKPLSNMQLNIGLYLLQLEHLRIAKKPMFKDPFQCLPWGPAILDVYYTYCGFGASPILLDMKDYPELDFRDQDLVDELLKKGIPSYPLIQGDPRFKEWEEDKDSVGHTVIPINLMYKDVKDGRESVF